MRLSIAIVLKLFDSRAHNWSMKNWSKKANKFKSCKLNMCFIFWTQYNIYVLFSSNLKEEYMNMMNNMSKNNLSPSSSNANDSDASRYYTFHL